MSAGGDQDEVRLAANMLADLPEDPLSSSTTRRHSSSIGETSDPRRQSFSRRKSLSVHREKITDIADPLRMTAADDVFSGEVDCLSLSSTDELRVISSINEASKKRMYGTVASVEIDFSSTGSLRLGVKDLHGGILVVSVLKRPDNTVGPGERSGIKIGELIQGYMQCSLLQ